MAFLSKYGEARVIEIPVIKRAVVDFAVGADWTPAAGDVKITKDGGAAANVTNLPTALAMGNGAVWSFSLTATEMQAARVVVTVVDAATKAVEDQSFVIETYGNASAQHAFDLDTASTAQTGDSFARLGAPAGASTAADIAAVKVDTAAILADTGTDGVVVAAASKTGYSLTATTGLGNQTSDITGSLSGSVGSVTGAVGSVTGNVGGNVAGSVGSVTGAVGSVTGNVGGNVVGSVGSVTARVTANTDQIAGSATPATNLRRGAEGLVASTCAVGSTTTSIVTNLTEATNDHYNGRVITFTSGVLAGQSTSISGYAGATKILTVVAVTEAPASTDEFVIS